VFPISHSQIAGGNTQLLSDIAVRNEKPGIYGFLA
jgi:hypothetical protein